MNNIKTWNSLAKDFGYILRDMRFRLKLSESELALKSGLDEVNGVKLIERLEQGLELPNLQLLILLAQGLRMSPGAMLAETLWHATRGYLFDDAQARHYWAPCLYRAGYYSRFGSVSLDRNAYDRFSTAFRYNVNILYGRDAPEPQFIAVYVQTGLVKLDQNREVVDYCWVPYSGGGAS